MKRAFLIVLLLMSLSSFAQTQTEIANLTKIGKVWGFLKYYHPAVAKGTINWDAELTKLLPISAQGAKQFESELEIWYHALPDAQLAVVPTQPKGDSILTVFDERDIKNFKLNTHFTKSLVLLYAYHLPDSNRYLTNTYKQYTLDFLLNREKEFNEIPFSNRDLRMLALFRYWNIINYQYPHKRLIGEPWDNILPRLIPLFWQAKDKTDYRNAVQRLTTAMRDSHAFYKEEEENRNQTLNVAFELVKLNHRYFVSGIYNEEMASKEGIKKGDQILRVNGMPVRRYEQLKLFGVTGSNLSSKYRDQARQLLRKDTSKTHQLLVARAGKTISLTVRRYTWEVLNRRPANQQKTESTLNWKQLEEGVWHVRFCAITTANELKEMFNAIQTAKKVIWDMRGYPTYSLLPQTFASLMPKLTHLGQNATANLFFPGTFTLKNEVYVPESPKFATYDGPMLVLVNAHTQSLAESVSAQLALRPQTIIMGSQTAGTTGNINYFDLPGGIQTSFTAVGFYGAKSSFLQSKGVKINVKVKIGNRPVSGKMDVLLQKALRHR